LSSVSIGRDVLLHQAQALLQLADKLDDRFDLAVQMVLECPGRVITCGIGKSGHIARKTSGTLSSTGTPSLFLHAAEAVHGDLGMIAPSDVVLLYSHSGETDEIVRLFAPIRELGAKSILVTGRADSSAARLADLVLVTLVSEESCPNNLAPTTSTTTMLALSDALAVAVMDRRGFGRDDFARLHPSGSLGKRLLLRVRDVMRPRNEIAVVSPEATSMEVVKAMTSAGMGVACVIENDALVGLISEGDLRRYLLKTGNIEGGTASEMVNGMPSTIDIEVLAIDALEAFQNHPKRIGEMPVLEHGNLAGVLVLKDLLRSGIV
jgi:arabinose-5-phosphate isomerase